MSDNDDLPPAFAGGILLLSSAALFFYTLAPTLLWGDDAMFQQAMATGALTDHPVWGAIAHLLARVPLGDYAFRANLASAIYAVGVVGFVFLTAIALGAGPRAAFSAGAILVISQAFWLHAVRAEVYTLHLLLFFGGVWAFLHWRQATNNWLWFVLGFAFWLAGAVNHLLLALAFPGGLWLLLSASTPVARRRMLSWLVAALIVGVLLLSITLPMFFTEYIPLAIRYVRAAFGFSPKRWMMDLALLLYQFPFLGIFAVPGFGYLWRRERAIALALALMALFTAVFAATFNVPDAYVFYLPVYALVALWAGIGVAVCSRHCSWPRFLFTGIALFSLQIGLYRLTPLVLERFSPRLIAARDLPGRPANAFFLWPSKRGYTGARWFAETVFDLLPPQALVVADWTLCTPLWYVQEVEGRRKDVLILEMTDSARQAIYENKGRRPLFLANADPHYYPIAEFVEQFRLEPAGPILQLIPKEGGP